MMGLLKCLIFGTCVLSPLYPNETGGQIANRHYIHYKKLITTDSYALYHDLSRWHAVKNTIRTATLHKQAESVDYVTVAMFHEPLNALLEFIDEQIIPSLSHVTLESMNEAAVGNLAYMLIHLSPKTKQWKELAKFYNE